MVFVPQNATLWFFSAHPVLHVTCDDFSSLDQTTGISMAIPNTACCLQSLFNMQLQEPIGTHGTALLVAKAPSVQMYSTECRHSYL